MQSLTITNDTEALEKIEADAEAPTSFHNPVPDYALLFFDHLYSEYLPLKPNISDSAITALFESLHEKRLKADLTWSDIYTFDLALVDQRPLENLIRKAYDARAKYRSIAGQKEFDEYLASKPPDLTTILIAPNNPPAAPDPATPSPAANVAPPAKPTFPPQSADIVQRILRADIRYLLSKFYLYYAMLPMRELYREELTTRAVRTTKWILAVIAVFILLSFGAGVLIDRIQEPNKSQFKAIGELLGAFGPVVGSVAFAGILGGCVSMIQRIQSAPSEGDALFNLAALTNGWRGLSLSPLYGGIFASLLFVLFASGLLQGSAFPRIKTLEVKESSSVSGKAVESATTQSATQVSPNTHTTTGDKPIPKLKEFLQNTGPQDGVAFALLIVWSFIAGFAERLVPDTLNRLVAKNAAIQGTNS
jgi:hypothetical protein